MKRTISFARLKPFFFLTVAFLFLAFPVHGEVTHWLPNAKKATALVEIQKKVYRSKTETRFASAFCVSKTGLFITNAHVIKSVPPKGTVKLVLDPGEKKQLTTNATIVRVDEKNDLAVLRAETPHDYTPLTLGEDGKLSEMLEVVALGYPFGKALSTTDNTYPNISVNSGEITSLRKTNGNLELIQLDAVLNPGNSGGPVLNKKGRVIAVVRGGIPGLGVNFAIPVSKLLSLLDKPELVVSLPALTAGNRNQPANFKAHVHFFRKPSKPCKVELTLKDSSGQRTAIMQTKADDEYNCMIIPCPKAKILNKVRALFLFPYGKIQCMLSEQSMSLNGKAYPLSNVATLTNFKDGTWEAQLADGKKVSGHPGGLKKLTVELGKQYKLALDLNQPKSATFSPVPDAQEEVLYRIVVKEGQNIVASESGVLNIAGVNAVAGTPPLTPLKPLSLEKPATIELSGTVDDMTLGGGGRYVLLHLKGKRKIAIVDLHLGRVTKIIPVDSDKVSMAAGKSDFVLLLPEKKLIQKYDLGNTYSRELSRAFPLEGDVKGIAMGHNSHGPIFVGTNTGLHVLNLKNLQPEKITHQYIGRSRGQYSLERYQYKLWAAADGKSVGMQRLHSSSGNLFFSQLKGNVLVNNCFNYNTGWVCPSPDGQLIFTFRGIYTSDLGRPMQRRNTQAVLPSTQNSFFVSCPFFIHGNTNAKPQLKIYNNADLQFLTTIEGLDEFDYQKHRQAYLAPTYRDLSNDQRVILLPHLKKLATIPPTNDKIILRYVDIMEQIRQGDADYLFITSSPCLTTRQGRMYEYSLTVASKKGGVTYKLDTHPTGMSISPAGLLTWNVPVNFPQSTVSVSLSVKDRSGQTVRQNFKIHIEPLNGNK